MLNAILKTNDSILKRTETMDLLLELRRKLSDLRAHDRSDGIKAAVRHIEVAERYLERGRSVDDPDAFNDVIYRSNQAFEGILKEAYSAIHTGKDATKLSPNEIEQYFIKSGKLSDRVSALFKNYRQQWRNPSTHDHTLLFSEQEAILAIASVSAFSLVLMNQIVEVVNFKVQRKETEQRRSELMQQWTTEVGKPLAEQVVTLLKSFNLDMYEKGQSFSSDAEVVGRFSGFVAGLNIGADITPEARLSDRSRADLLLRKADEAVIVEIKRRGRTNNDRLIEGAITQLTGYLNVAKVESGIVYLWSAEIRPTINEQSVELQGQKKIWVLGGD